MRHSRVRLAGTVGASLLAMLASAEIAEAGPGDDVHHFEIRVVSSGSATADYGEDRKRPGQTTAAGVDGMESGEWRWEVRAVAFSTGAGPLVTRAKTGRARWVLTTSLVSYGIQMGNVGEEPLCDPYHGGTTTFLSNDGAGRTAKKSGLGEFVHRGRFRLYGGEISASPPSGPAPHSCLHGPTGDGGLRFVDDVGADDAPVRRGAFNPRSDRKFERTYRSAVRHDRSQAGDPNSAHTFTAQSELEVRFKAISARRFNKLVKKYQHLPVDLPGSGETEYHDPPV